MPQSNHLDEDLKETNKLLKKFVSKKHAFYRGIISGLGASLGATIVITILLWVFSQLEYLPVIGDLARFANQFLQDNIINSTQNPVN